MYGRFYTKTFTGGRAPSMRFKSFLKAKEISYLTFIGTAKNMRFKEYFIPTYSDIYVMGCAGDNPLVKDSSAEDPTTDVMIQKCPHRDPFYISDQPEKLLARRIGGYSSYLAIVGGALISILSLFILALLIWGFYVT
jgi:hypothetical protein